MNVKAAPPPLPKKIVVTAFGKKLGTIAPPVMKQVAKPAIGKCCLHK